MSERDEIMLRVELTLRDLRIALDDVDEDVLDAFEAKLIADVRAALDEYDEREP